MKPSLEKRLTALEARHVSTGDRWPPLDCDWKRRLAKYAAYFEERPWVCTGTPERKARRDVKLARYKRYFDELQAGVEAPRWD
jgi:hypothetical protein